MVVVRLVTAPASTIPFSGELVWEEF